MPLTANSFLRRCRFSPYRRGKGPTFTLTTWDLGRPHHDGASQWGIGYRLTMREPGKRPVVLFEAEDYGCSPLHCIDSDECINGLMGFLTCKPGDTDPEYFENYTPQQLAYCSAHAEALSSVVYGRFGDL
jgi:hypothetical protein